MKKLRSRDNLESYVDKGITKDWRRREDDLSLHRSSSSRRRSYYRSSKSLKKGSSSSSSRYDSRESSRLVRKRMGGDERKNHGSHKDGKERRILSSSPRAGYGIDRMNSCESFLGPRRDFPKGFRSERDRSRREGRVSSWWKFGADGTQSDGGVRGSEREEGELEHDPQLVSDAVVMDETAVKLNSRTELNSECNGENNVLQEKENFTTLEQEDVKVGEAAKFGLSREAQEVLDKAMELPYCPDTSLQGTGASGDENEIMIGSGGCNAEEAIIEAHSGDIEATCAKNPSASQEEQKEDKVIDLEVKEVDTDMGENEGLREECEVPGIELTGQNLKDKGKIVPLLPANSPHSAEGLEVENISKEDLQTFGETEMEDTSTRGFEYFSINPVKEEDTDEQSSHNQPKDEKLALELSLSLPNVLLPSGAHNRGLAPGSPSHGRSAQSFPSTFYTNSDGLTMSTPFSGSQQLSHNPSCSLTTNTFDYEKSVGSRPIIQGVNWKASSSSDDNKNKEVPVSQGMGSIGNGLQKHSQAFRVNQLTSNTQYSKESRQVTKEKDSGTLHKISYSDGEKQALVVGPDFAESIITMIVSEPVESMAQRFNDIAENHVAFVKDFVHDIISNPGKCWQLRSLQKELQNRSDIQLDVLMELHRPQLEILVALKMGLQEFLDQNLLPSDLAEIFLNMRCKNLTCRSLLPVDECDCKICEQKNGFCRECMCLVCSKFDTASNTCSWVGCDVCLHWCHADCGLRESRIRNGNSISGSQGTTEMQFHCLACDHPSEMFGFVKEVFQNFFKEWTAENLSRELEYVRRIFSATNDERGKQLHGIAIQMLSKLKNKADLQEMQKQIMAFFSEADSLKPGNVDVQSKIQGLNRVSGSRQGAAWLKSIHSEKAPHLENSISLLPSLDQNRNDKYISSLDLQTEVRKESVFDELEGIVRIKQAEAKMFQTRADDATREAETLKRVAVAKKERIEEEYASRIIKLRLAEAEDMCKQKVEELQACERAYQEYFYMKMRVETDIKDLLLKMEITRRTYPHN